LRIRAGAASNEPARVATTEAAPLSGEYGQVLRVVAMNPAEGWSRDASEDVAHALELRVATGYYEISEALRDFIEGQTGRKIGQQLSLL
jgi:hypothetical protein